MYRVRRVKDYIFIAVVIILSLVAITPIFHLIYVVIMNGTSIFVKDGLNLITGVPPSPLSDRGGGIAPAIIGTLLMVTVSLPISITIGFFAAILSNEFPRFIIARIVEIFAKSFASIPTIIVSMAVYTIVVVPMRQFSALAGTIALAIVTLPYTYTSFLTVLNSVPSIYRDAALALGMSKWKVIKMVIIPIARRGLATGILISMARSMGETAALLFTAGRYRAGINYLLSQPVDALPLLIFDFVLTPFRRYHELAWAASFLLFLSYLIVFIAVKLIVKEVKL